MTQTAVDQLIEEIEKRMILIHFETHKPTREVMILNLPMNLERFKEMEKQQIIKAYQQGVTDEHGDTITFTTEGEDYYNTLFKS
jgi:hypothetical protein